MIVTIRETAISKLQQLPEVLVQEVSDFIVFSIINIESKPLTLSLMKTDRKMVTMV